MSRLRGVVRALIVPPPVLAIGPGITRCPEFRADPTRP